MDYNVGRLQWGWVALPRDVRLSLVVLGVGGLALTWGLETGEVKKLQKPD